MNNFWRTVMRICTPGRYDPAADNFDFKPMFKVVAVRNQWPTPDNDNEPPPDDKQWPA